MGNQKTPTAALPHRSTREAEFEFCAFASPILTEEPSATRALVEKWNALPPLYDGEGLHSAIEAAVSAADGAPHDAELEQLHRQGVGRFVGLIVIAQRLGVIEKSSGDTARASMPGARTFTLGRSLTKFKQTKDYGPCTDFLKVAREEERSLNSEPPSFSVDGLLEYGRRAKMALQRIGAVCPAIPTKGGEGYTIDFFVRKLVCARALQAPRLSASTTGT